MDNDQDKLTLDNLMIAAPCDVAWDDMVGNDTVRRCLDCKLNVFNIENMTEREVEDLLGSEQARSGRLCVQLYRRPDGTLLTADCPKGLQKIRALSNRIWRSAAAALALIIAGSAAIAQDKDKAPTAPATPPPVGHRTAGIICPPNTNKQPANTNVTAGSTKGNTGGTTNPSAKDKEKTTQQPASGNGTQGGKAAQGKKIDSESDGDTHHSKARTNAFNLYREGQQMERAGNYARAAEVYHQALTVMSGQKYDPKFHLKIETALSRVKAKAGINQ